MDQSKFSPEPTSVQEFVVRIPNKDQNKRYNVMKFDKSLNMDIANWKQIKMERENNLKDFKPDEDSPKFGAGSEFGREQKEEARRKKHGITIKHYNPDEQPWLMRMGGKGGKKYKGLRDGGVADNASYYMFTKAANGVFEAYPVEEFYKFRAVSCYKPLSAEEAEQRFTKRDEVLNFFAIKVRKKLHVDTVDDDDEEDKKPGTKKKKKKKPQKDFKISDMDDCPQLDNSAGESEDEEDDVKDRKNPKKKPTKKEKKKKDSDDEALEESDEGDFDDKEMDYITSGSSDEEELEEDDKGNVELKGVEDEDAMRKMSDDEDEEEEQNKEAEEPQENKEKVADQKAKQKQKKSDSSGESSSDSSDSDLDDGKFQSAIFVSKSKKKNGSDNSTGSSRANTPTKQHGDKEGQKSQKRRCPDVASSCTKKPKLENQHAGASSMSNTLDAINEESVRRYLQRKPMTASELLQKFKNKKITKVNAEQLVTKIADVLKKLDPQKVKVKGKMYLSLSTK